MTPLPTRHAALILALALGAATFLLDLGGRRVTASHEARVGLTARAMADAGPPWAATPVRVGLPRGRGSADVNPWLIPVFEGSVRLQKPPVPYWTSAGLMRLGVRGEWAIRLVPAVLGLLATVLVYDLARQLGDRRLAGPAALVWVTLFSLVENYRRGMADPYLAFFALAALVAWVRACRASGREGGAAGAGLVAAWAAVGIGLMAKGPVVLIHVVVPAAALAWTHGLRPRRSWGWHARWQAIGLVGLLAVGLPWPAYVLTHLPGTLEVWRYESVGEFADNARNARPWWYYGPIAVELTLPWTPLVVAGLARSLRSAWRLPGRRRRELFAPLWLGAIVVFFSLAHMKKEAYLLPVVPAVALLAARGVVGASAMVRRGMAAGRGWRLVQAGVGVAFAGVFAVMVMRPPAPGSLAAVDAAGWGVPGVAARLGLAAAVVSVTVAPMVPRLIAARRWAWWQAGGLAVAVAGMIVLPGTWAQDRRPSLLDRSSARSVAEQGGHAKVRLGERVGVEAGD